MEWPNPKVTAPTIDGQTQGPAFAATRIDFEVETAAVGMPAWLLDIFDGSDRQAVQAARRANGLHAANFHKQNLNLYPQFSPTKKCATAGYTRCRQDAKCNWLLAVNLSNINMLATI